MDLLPDQDALTMWLLNYGSFALFALLAVGIIALPVPEETLMMLSGFLISNGYLYIFPTVAAAFLGSICGITVSYLLGRTAGKFLLDKYGIWLGLTPDKLQVVHNWFERYGKWTLFFGYFVPGVRHFTGLVAGMAGLEYHLFALFAYIGAIVWASTFLSIGYFFGDYWAEKIEGYEFSIEQLLLFATLAILAFIGIRMLHSKLNKPKSQ